MFVARVRTHARAGKPNQGIGIGTVVVGEGGESTQGVSKAEPLRVGSWPRPIPTYSTPHRWGL
jgi:hypothetical protein